VAEELGRLLLALACTLSVALPSSAWARAARALLLLRLLPRLPLPRLGVTVAALQRAAPELLRTALA
jgi:hypothetical protein